MLTLKALPDGLEDNLSCLGTLCPLGEEPSVGVRLVKKISVEGVGSCNKKLNTPLYSGDVLGRLSVTDPNRSFSPAHCVGALCTGIAMEPIGYVDRSCGAHHFCLPVYPVQSIPSAFYRIAGYLPTADGFVAVVRRRILLWCMLGLCAGAAFVLSYLIFQYGTDGAFEELMRFGGSMLP